MYVPCNIIFIGFSGYLPALQSSIPLFTGLVASSHDQTRQEWDHVKRQEETSSFSLGLSSTLSLFDGLLLPLDAISISPGLNSTLSLFWYLAASKSWHDFFLRKRPALSRVVWALLSHHSLVSCCLLVQSLSRLVWTLLSCCSGICCLLVLTRFPSQEETRPVGRGCTCTPPPFRQKQHVKWCISLKLLATHYSLVCDASTWALNLNCIRM